MISPKEFGFLLKVRTEHEVMSLISVITVRLWLTLFISQKQSFLGDKLLRIGLVKLGTIPSTSHAAFEGSKGSRQWDVHYNLNGKLLQYAE